MAQIGADGKPDLAPFAACFPCQLTQAEGAALTAQVNYCAQHCPRASLGEGAMSCPFKMDITCFIFQATQLKNARVVYAVRKAGTQQFSSFAGQLEVKNGRLSVRVSEAFCNIPGVEKVKDFQDFPFPSQGYEYEYLVATTVYLQSLLVTARAEADSLRAQVATGGGQTGSGTVALRQVSVAGGTTGLGSDDDDDESTWQWSAFDPDTYGNRSAEAIVNQLRFEADVTQRSSDLRKAACSSAATAVHHFVVARGARERRVLLNLLDQGLEMLMRVVCDETPGISFRQVQVASRRAMDRNNRLSASAALLRGKEECLARIENNRDRRALQPRRNKPPSRSSSVGSAGSSQGRQSHTAGNGRRGGKKQ
jgi:hypothetical protein